MSSTLRRTLRVWALVVAAASMACASGPVRLGTPIPTAFDASSAEPVVSSACGFMLFAFIPLGVAGSLNRAHASLLDKAPERYVTDVKIGTHWTYALVGTVQCVDMQATAYTMR